ncbi:MAG: LysR family transcriptional regulator [Nitrososphaeria archaeon]|nr:LysR family transcriptional regulator [Nitrososphaeria archaeon]
MNSLKEKIGFIKMLNVKTSFSIKLENRLEGIDEKSAKLLHGIRKFGSIMMAAKYVGEDYKLAWTRINELEKEFGCKLVERSFGGLGGGSAKLTIEGETLLQKYLLVEKKFKMINKKELLKADLSIFGSHCPTLEILIETLEKKYRGFFVEYVNVGSYEGLTLVLKGFSDISGIHLFDEKTGEYNTYLLKNKVFGEKISIIRGYRRTQGIVTKKGNPKKIFSIKDLLRKDVTFINRNKGSGTRFLIDRLIMNFASNEKMQFDDVIKQIRGYNNEVRSHLEVAVAVKEGKVDCGFAIKAVAKLLNLNFIPFTEEVFDFVILKKNIGKDNIQKFILTLSSKDFQEKVLEKDFGIRFFENTGELVKEQ